MRCRAMKSMIMAVLLVATLAMAGCAPAESGVLPSPMSIQTGTTPVNDPTESVHFSQYTTYTVGAGQDDRHFKVEYVIDIENVGSSTANHLRILVDTSTMSQGPRTFEATAGWTPVNLAPNESARFTVTWESDLAEIGKVEFVQLLKRDIVRVSWSDNDGVAREKVLMKDGTPVPDITK